MKKMRRVLLVDDDEITNFYNQHLIQKMGITEEIHTVLNGREAIDFLTTEVGGSFPHPDIILLDINMPVMNGFEFLTAHDALPEAQRAQNVFLMLTTELLPEDKAKTTQYATLTGFLDKPLSEDQLMKSIS